ncbi:hypothetical protein [Streptomyces luteolifulvus]|uniref:hypothetical protein n=1 Tax=Streptomyces luteolifulvus TaxID=2615112 RepID=UPI00178406B4|nr:hypothetical protein [Streptomyces luteolifulvus]
MRTHRAVFALLSALLVLLIPTSASATPAPAQTVKAGDGTSWDRVVPPWARYAGRA